MAYLQEPRFKPVSHRLNLEPHWMEVFSPSSRVEILQVVSKSAGQRTCNTHCGGNFNFFPCHHNHLPCFPLSSFLFVCLSHFFSLPACWKAWWAPVIDGKSLLRPVCSAHTVLKLLDDHKRHPVVLVVHVCGVTLLPCVLCTHSSGATWRGWGAAVETVVSPLSPYTVSHFMWSGVHCQ